MLENQIPVLAWPLLGSTPCSMGLNLEGKLKGQAAPCACSGHTQACNHLRQAWQSSRLVKSASQICWEWGSCDFCFGSN